MITPKLPNQSPELTLRQQWRLLVDERVKYAAEHGSMVDGSGGLCRIVAVSVALWASIGIGVALWILN